MWYLRFLMSHLKICLEHIKHLNKKKHMISVINMDNIDTELIITHITL